MFEISAQNGLRDVILGREGKTSDLAANFLRNSGAAKNGFVYYSNVQRTFKDGKLSQPYLRGHMR